jgi:hypothetical protein
MNRLAPFAIAACMWGASGVAAAQAAPAAAPSAAPAASASAPAQRAAPRVYAGEPKVEYIVLEDEGTRIEELRVRGTTQRIVVKPKVGTTTSYEIITGDGSRDLSPGVNTSRGAAGQRVWHVLSF